MVHVRRRSSLDVIAERSHSKSCAAMMAKRKRVMSGLALSIAGRLVEIFSTVVITIASGDAIRRKLGFHAVHGRPT